MKDKITFKNLILAIIGFLVFAFLIVPIGETLIYQSRYKSPEKELIEINSDDFYMKINKFVASNVDGLVNVDIIKKNDKWRYAEVQVIDKDGYVIHREYADLLNSDIDSKFNLDFGYRGEDSALLNIVGADEFKEPATIFNRFKNAIKNSKIYKEFEKFYNKYLKGVFKLDWSELKAKVTQIPAWLKSLYLQGSAIFFGLHPGLRSIIVIAIAMLFI